jgi:hypothetical protein
VEVLEDWVVNLKTEETMIGVAEEVLEVIQETEETEETTLLKLQAEAEEVAAAGTILAQTGR